MARFWQSPDAPSISPPGEIASVSSVPHEKPIVSTEVVKEASKSTSQANQWHFLEVGPSGLEEGTPEVLWERKGQQRGSKAQEKGPGGHEWSLPKSAEVFAPSVLRPILGGINSIFETNGGGVVVASHSQGVGPAAALSFILGLGAKAAGESWKVAVVGAEKQGGFECGLPSGPGWFDYLQGGCHFGEAIHPWRDGEIAWIPPGRDIDPSQPVFFQHSPLEWVRELKRKYPAILMVCGDPGENTLLSTMARVGDGVLLLAKFQESHLIDRFREDWSRKGVPFVGQVILPDNFSVSSTR